MPYNHTHKPRLWNSLRRRNKRKESIQNSLKSFLLEFRVIGISSYLHFLFCKISTNSLVVFRSSAARSRNYSPSTRASKFFFFIYLTISPSLSVAGLSLASGHSGRKLGRLNNIGRIDADTWETPRYYVRLV